jgi:hypothetical protein
LPGEIVKRLGIIKAGIKEVRLRWCMSNIFKDKLQAQAGLSQITL